MKTFFVFVGWLTVGLFVFGVVLAVERSNDPRQQLPGHCGFGALEWQRNHDQPQRWIRC